MQKAIGKRLMLAAAISLAFTPIAAQANTRPGNTAVYYVASANPQPGLQRAAEGEDKLLWFSDDLLTILLGSLGVATALAMVFAGGSSSGSGGFQSNGAN